MQFVDPRFGGEPGKRNEEKEKKKKIGGNSEMRNHLGHFLSQQLGWDTTDERDGTSAHIARFWIDGGGKPRSDVFDTPAGLESKSNRVFVSEVETLGIIDGKEGDFDCFPCFAFWGCRLFDFLLLHNICLTILYIWCL